MIRQGRSFARGRVREPGSGIREHVGSAWSESSPLLRTEQGERHGSGSEGSFESEAGRAARETADKDTEAAHRAEDQEPSRAVEPPPPPPAPVPLPRGGRYWPPQEALGGAGDSFLRTNVGFRGRPKGREGTGCEIRVALGNLLPWAHPPVLRAFSISRRLPHTLLGPGVQWAGEGKGADLPWHLRERTRKTSFLNPQAFRPAAFGDPGESMGWGSGGGAIQGTCQPGQGCVGPSVTSWVDLGKS